MVCDHLTFNINSALLKLISPPISVLLEDEGNKTSSEGHDQTVVVLLS